MDRGDYEGGDAKRQRKDEEVELCTPTFKMLAPKTLASAIHFSAAVIENAAQGKLSMTEPDDVYPGTDQQVITIESSSWDSIVTAMKHILAMVNNCSECVMPGHEDERRVAVVMPSRSISALIGVKGANVKELQQRTGCHIHVDDVAIGHGPGGDRAVNINGMPAGLDQALVRTVNVVQESHDQIWFAKWAARTNAERLEQEQAPPLRGGTLPKAYQQQNANDVGGCGDMMAMNPMMAMMGAMMGGMNPMMGMGGMTGMGAMGAAPMLGAGRGSTGCGGCGMPGMGGCGMGGCGMGCGTGCGMAGCMDGGMGGMCGMGGCAGGMGGCGAPDDGYQMVMHVMEDMPDFVTQDPRGFVMRSAVPASMATVLQKKAIQVMSSTNTKITFSGDPNTAARIMSIQGPIFNTCAAYMLMMRRYIEIEREGC